MAFITTRKIAADPSSVFAAFADAGRLARWWGPAGFTNTFETCEFVPGGGWRFVMHGSNGKHYPNESVFLEIEPCRRIVIRHVSPPGFLLTVDLEPTAQGGTLIRWEQTFDDPRVEKGVEHIVVPANEQNLDRLTAEVVSGRTG